MNDYQSTHYETGCDDRTHSYVSTGTTTYAPGATSDPESVKPHIERSRERERVNESVRQAFVAAKAHRAEIRRARAA